MWTVTSEEPGGDVGAAEGSPPEGRPPPSESSLVSTLVLGVVVGITEVTVATSFAALIFAGPLAGNLAAGVGLSLLAATVTVAVLAVRSSGIGAVGTVQDITAVVVGVMAASVAARMPVASDERFLTLMLMIGLTSIVTGAVFWVVGRFGWGNLVRFVPYPVVAGFVAGTGWLILKGGASLLSGVALTWSSIPDLFDGDVAVKWLPGVALAAAVHLLLARYGRPIIVPAAVVAGAAGFYAVVYAAGSSLGEAEAGGWLLGPFPSGSLVEAWLPSAATGGDWSVALSQAGTVPSLVLLALVALLLNVSGIEVATGRDVDVNRELRAAGVANLVGGVGGGLIGFHSPTLTLLSHRAGANVRVVGLVTAAVSALALLFGASVVGNTPKLVIGGLLVFLGVDLLADSVVRSRRRLPVEEYALVVLILLTIAVLGFLAGVAIGVLAAIALFAVNYSRTDVVKHELSGRTYRSKVERSASEQTVLQRAGDQIHILELQGFVFFGTAFGLLTRIRERSVDGTRPPLRFLVLDFRGVTGLDSSAALSFKRAQQLAGSEGFTFVITGLSDRTLVQLQRNGLAPGVDLPAHPDLDHGVEWCEERLLHGAGGSEETDEAAFPSHLHDLVGDGVDVAALMGYLERVEVPAGHRIIRQGDPPGDVYFLAAGRLTAALEQEDGSTVRLRTMGPGTVVGEVAMYLQTPRTASVVSERASVVYRLSQESVERMQEEHPGLVAALHRCFGRLLALRLANTLRTVDALLS